MGMPNPEARDWFIDVLRDDTVGRFPTVVGDRVFWNM